MSRIARPTPRRWARIYPVGTRLTLRDGRTFEVTTEPVRMWVDDGGYGGGRIENRQSVRFWREVTR